MSAAYKNLFKILAGFNLNNSLLRSMGSKSLNLRKKAGVKFNDLVL